MDEMDAMFGTISETWLTDGDPLSDDVEDLRAGAGLGLLVKNRPPNARGHSHGGVALVYKENAVNFTEIAMNNPDSYEILVASGRFAGFIGRLAYLHQPAAA